VGCCCSNSKRVRTLVVSGWNVHLGREMAVCLIVIPGGRVVVYLSPCVNPRERELARKREPEHEYVWKEEGEIPWKKDGRNTIWYMVSYRMVYGIVPYGIGIVPYGIGPQGGKTACMCEKEACLLHKNLQHQ
jgi:hypothetical protein